jgi:hypothetical protein
MKVIMINDCAFVGETLLKYMSPDIEKQHIKRSRGLWSKTFGLAYKILRMKGDVYHAHYLLQDFYIATRLGRKPLIGHAYGNDLRASLKHPLWARIVRHNLKKCDKVLVSTTDVLDIAKRFRENAEYLPNPVDTEIFYHKPIPEHPGKKRALSTRRVWMKRLAQLKLLGHHITTALRIPYAFALVLYILILILLFGDLEEETCHEVLMVKGLMLNKNISLLDKIFAIVSDQLDFVHFLYCRKHRIYNERPVSWYCEPVFVICPKCFEEKFGENRDFLEIEP